MALSTSEVADYFKTQNPSATPLSPAQYEATLRTPASAPAAPAPVNAAQPTGGALPGADISKQGQPGYDVFGNKVPGYQAPSTSGTGSTGGATSPAQDAQTQINNDNAQLDTAFNNFNNYVTGVRNSSIPLSAGEQAQVDSLTQQYQQLINDAKLQATGATGLANRRGFENSNTPNPLYFANVVNTITAAGTARVADLTTKMSSAVANLTMSLRNNDIAQARAQWQDLQDYTKNRKAELQKTVDDAQKAIKDANDAKIAAQKVQYDEITKPLNDLAASAAKNGAPTNIVNAIKSSGDVGAGIAAAGGWLQEATGDLGRYLDYKRSTEATGKVAASYDDWLKADKAATSQQKINEAYSTAYASAKGKAAGELAGGGGVTNLKPLTEVQAKAFTYAQRADQSNTIIQSLQDKIVGMDAASYSTSKAAEGNDFLNQFVPPDVRQIRQAERNFATAILRQESGAAISPSEFATVEAQYFPRPGDDTVTLQQKAVNRQTAIDSFKANVPNYDDRASQTTGGVLQQAEDLAKQNVIQYGQGNPTAQQAITQMINEGKPYTQIVQLLGI